MIDLIGQAMRDAAQRLRRSLRVYWPTEGTNEMPEAHTLSAVGHALARRKCHIYAEVQCRWQREIGHVDLLAINPQRRVGIAIEAKRLYNAGGAAELLADWTRLGQARLASQYKPLPRLDTQYRMIVATTWQSGIMAWWNEGGRKPGTAGTWLLLENELASAAKRDAHELQRDPRWGRQWLLYAVGRRPLSFFTGGRMR